MSENAQFDTLKGQVAIVVGGSGGIGSETCRLLAQSGATVVIGYRSGEAKAREIAEALPGSGHIALRVSIEDTSSIQAFCAAALSACGRADILVNAAGVTKPVPHADLDALTDEIIDQVFVSNWRGVFATIRAFAPALAANGRGLIVNVSSIAAFTGIGSNIAYCGAKAGLDIMTNSLGRALAPAVRVMAVSPGVVDTEFVPGRDQEFKDKAAAATPLKRLTTPTDVAEAILACATHLKFSTGARIIVDGGRHL
ncbi:NAD(P)-dependent dehydrogenase (short-subunit alcohol dehydrogenase family) [Rhizobium tibeticum]|uniref:SDR family NAD(P)-dependent oxidoreductase n=1 Tax=Rhizobium tibeticum TaxID=501024 RepID=UPI00277D3D93|nr:SDR family oxidoreductase [Rhizobium tibeticum]MDP9810072.1 NAD(P)-dependent dehydrogenase (short-subunit alcohol dehydrogenase family) [Rhizobium tibeticum]